jgi:hypothetical protein
MPQLASIQILSVDKHPFLVDHRKELITLGKDGKRIDSLKLYYDSGSGCNSYLFDNKEYYTLIDCNGSKYRIDKRNGKISFEIWEWKKDLPQNYIGTFKFVNNEYKVTEEETISIEKVYKFKDPND